MDTAERNQVRLILEHLSSETLRATDQAQKALIAECAAAGTLQSGATVKRTVAIIEAQSGLFVEKVVDQVSAVAQDIDAFNVIAASLTALFRGLEPHLRSAVRKATAGSPDQFASVDSAGSKLLVDAQSRIFRQLELHRFSFTKMSAGDRAAMQSRISIPSITKVQAGGKPNAGGKPLAPHWDAMWAAIAVQLWSGDLKPKTQADVKQAMFDWFNKAEIEIGDTALTQRARQLWQAMQAYEG